MCRKSVASSLRKLCNALINNICHATAQAAVEE